MATVRVRIAILTVRITLSLCRFNRMAHTNPTVLPDEATPVVALVCDMFLLGRRLVNHYFNSAVFLTDPRLRPKTLFPSSKSNR
jgi:hypothetical protein